MLSNTAKYPLSERENYPAESHCSSEVIINCGDRYTQKPFYLLSKVSDPSSVEIEVYF